MSKVPTIPSTGGAPVIIWFRNDLRLHDQAALAEAAAAGGPVLPVYVLDEAAAGEWAPGGASRWWLHHSLASLAEGIESRGGRLILRRGDAPGILGELADRVGAAAIHAGTAIEPWARLQADRVAKALPSGTPLVQHRTVTLFDPESIRTKTGGAYGVYTPFANACRARPVEAPKPLPRAFTTPDVPSDRLADWALLPTHPDWAGGLRETWTPGEDGAATRLSLFLKQIAGYATARNLPGEDGTSMLSPHLHWGEVSPNQVWHLALKVKEASQGAQTFLNEILWREFSAHLLWHHPTLPEKPLRPAFAAMPWRRDRRAMHAWTKGRTGIPIVDAGLRQLWRTGWMHNRVRMIAASFLIKHLLVDWVEGERWFWDTLCDADLGSNAASWQWVAGSGADAAPFFRVFNPVTQGEKFDPGGAYVRRFVPEIAALPDRVLHAPWTAPPDLLAQAGIELGRTYPRPIVDLAAGRARALDAFRRIGQAA